MTLRDWAMFSNEGNRRVQQIVESAMDRAGTVTDNELWQWTYSSLELLSREPDFKEATDTEVREQIWELLCNEQMIDRMHTQYWFYINWYDLEQQGEKPFHACVGALDDA